MFGFLKKLTKKSEPQKPAQEQPVSAPSTQPAAQPASPQGPPGSKTVMPAVSSRPVPTPLTPVAPTVAPAPKPAALPTFSGPTVDLPLRGIWEKLNPSVVQSAQGKPGSDAQLKLPLELIQPMLARGAVKMPYSHFRQFAPAGLFPVIPEKESLEVDVPLFEVLARVKPGQLVRRQQKKIEVPEEIPAIFGKGGEGLKISDGKPTQTPGTPASPPAVAPEAPKPPEPALPPVPAAPRIPEVKAAPPLPPPPPRPAPIAPVPVPITPISPITPIAPSESVPVPPSTPLVSEPIRAPKLDPALASLKPKPLVPPAVPPAPLAVPKPPAPKPVVPVPAPVAPVAPGKAVEGTFKISMADMEGHWAVSGKTELAALAKYTVEIPVSRLEQSLKSGKIVFPWRELRSWVSGAGEALPSLADDFSVELPLAVVAPQFMAQRAGAAPKKRVEVGEDIPDLFAQKAAPPTPGPAPTAAPPATPSVPAPSAARPALEFGEIFGQPDKKTWTLAEVSQKTAGLRGVTGALIATSDGLLIAGTWPSGVKTDAVAAFIPQMYSRMVQCTKELNLGEPGNFTLTIENVPLQIFKTAGNFFAVLGKAGENLPKTQLGALATRLAMTQPGK